jgi:hypothetical protein
LPCRKHRDRPDDDRVDFLGQQVFHVGDLLGRLPVGFHENELADFFMQRRFVFHFLDHLNDPGIAYAAERHANAPRWSLFELVGLGLLRRGRRHQPIRQDLDIGGQRRT